MDSLFWADRKATDLKWPLTATQQKTTPGTTPVRKEQETEATNLRTNQSCTVKDWKNIAWSNESWFPCNIQMGPSCLVLIGMLVVVQRCGRYLLGTTRALVRPPEYCCWSSLYDHSVSIFWCQKAQITSWLYSNGHHSHLISKNTFGTWLNERIISWMWNWQICNSCVTLSLQHTICN